MGRGAGYAVSAMLAMVVSASAGGDGLTQTPVQGLRSWRQWAPQYQAPIANNYRVVYSNLVENLPNGGRTEVFGTEDAYDYYRFSAPLIERYLGFTDNAIWGAFRLYDIYPPGYGAGDLVGGYYDGTYQGGVVIGVTQRIDPAWLGEQAALQRSGPEPEPERTIDLVTGLLGSGSYSSAIEAFDGFGTLGGDAGAPWPDDRLRAVALVGVGRVEEAAEAMLDAFLLDPTLASEALDGATLAPTSRDFRNLLNATVDAANRADRAEHWLLVAVLMQAEGRDEAAAKMLARARDLGLDEDVVGAFTGALGALPETPSK